MTASTYAPHCLPSSAPRAARTVFRLLGAVPHGVLDVQLPDGSSARYGQASSAATAPRAAIRLHNWNVCAAALRSGDIGVAETYLTGDWTTPDLAALMRFFLVNREAVEQLVYGRWWGSLLHRVQHLLRRNTRQGSRRNIHAHYDLGNSFYRLWLDDSMNYSSAWFGEDRAQPMHAAQLAKMRRALQQAGATPGARVLEIGCGWGAVAELAAREFDARLVGVTLSTEQLEYGQARLRAAGLGSRAELRFQDYRDIDDGPYDAIVSIEMFEAVGREYWPAYFAALRRQLKPGGRACIQSITIRDDLFERYVRSTDFIQQYIFPGGLLPSVSAFHAAAEQAGLKVLQTFGFGPDYAETLRRWRERFLAQEAQVRQLGFDTHFVRLWEFYLAYCEAAFDTGCTGVVQFTLERA